ncbi:MAG: glycoside hydrolase family 20 zincin-like fold domain-containing protein [Oscillospiraceae bacterium]|jgi:N-acetyl-beta-hexosaminidase|nr:glycoside hydrolase family 20 zincin-like fold domain-containing protein [Oscillospiraceae bacterium]
MEYTVYPPPRQIEYRPGECALDALGEARCGASGDKRFFSGLPESLRPAATCGEGYEYTAGRTAISAAISGGVDSPQGYRLTVAPGGITLRAADAAGLRYGADTLAQLVAQAQNGALRCVEITDWPSIQN